MRKNEILITLNYMATTNIYLLHRVRNIIGTSCDHLFYFNKIGKKNLRESALIQNKSNQN